MFSNRHYPQRDEPLATTIRRTCKVCCRSLDYLCMNLLRPQIQRKSYSLHRPFQNFPLQFKKPQRKTAAISWGKDASPTSPVKSRSRRSWRCERGSRGCVFKVHIKWKITLRWILWDVAYHDGALFREFRALIRVVSQYIVIWIKSYLVQKESPRLVRGNNKHFTSNSYILPQQS